MSWHRERAIAVANLKLYHKTLWTALSTRNGMSVMRFESRKACLEYCERTGAVPLPPENCQAKEEGGGKDKGSAA